MKMPKVSIISPSIRPEGLKVVQDSLAKQTFQDFEWLVEIGIPEKGYDLNHAFNRMLRRAQGDLCVFLQDHIEIPVDGIQRFVEADNGLTLLTAPVGKKQDDGTVKWDWRIHKEAIMDWMRWEIDWGAAPLKILKEIGGFDEWLDDKTWTFDGVNVGFRAWVGGYEFDHLPNNRAVAFDHDAHQPHPFRSNFKPEFHNQRLDEFRKGLRINYLTE